MSLARYQKPFLYLLSSVRAFEADTSDLHTLLEIQIKLTRCIGNVELQLRSYRQRAKDLRSSVRQQHLSRDESSRLKKQQARFFKKVKEHQWLLFVFRTIGDALAFTLFDKYDLKPLAFRESPGWITGKRGGRLESRILRGAIIKAGIPAIRTDLTNSIRYGDIAVKLHDTIRLFEVKSGKNRNARTGRQLEAITKISKYLTTDSVDGLYGLKEQIFRREAHEKESHHIGLLNEIIGRSKTEGVCICDVEPGVRYVVLRQWDKTIIERLGVGISEAVAFILDAKSSALWTGYYPFTLSIRDPADVFDFLQGLVTIVVIVDLKHLKNIAGEFGYEAQFINSDFDVLCTAMRKEQAVSAIKIFHHWLGRVAFEFCSLRWLLREALQFNSPPSA